jgi:hypothetical protein
MPRPIRSIEIHFPLDYNDGRPIEEPKFATLEDELLDRFGGVTSIQKDFPLRGLWRSEATTFQDHVVIFTVIDFETKTDFEVIRYLERLKTRLRRRFDQLDVLITIQELLAV